MSKERLTARQRILKYLNRVRTVKTAREVADACDLTIVRACGLLKSLCDDGDVVRDGARCFYTYELAAA